MFSCLYYYSLPLNNDRRGRLAWLTKRQLCRPHARSARASHDPEREIKTTAPFTFNEFILTRGFKNVVEPQGPEEFLVNK